MCPGCEPPVGDLTQQVTCCSKLQVSALRRLQRGQGRHCLQHSNDRSRRASIVALTDQPGSPAGRACPPHALQETSSMVVELAQGFKHIRQLCSTQIWPDRAMYDSKRTNEPLAFWADLVGATGPWTQRPPMQSSRMPYAPVPCVVLHQLPHDQGCVGPVCLAGTAPEGT